MGVIIYCGWEAVTVMIPSGQSRSTPCAAGES